MTKSRMIALIEQLETEAANEAVGLLEFHGALRADLESLRQQVAAKAADDEARYTALVEQLDDAKAEAMQARKSAAEFFGKVTDWLDGKAVDLRRRMDADAGERQPAPSGSNVKPLGKVSPVSIEALRSLKDAPAGTANGHAEPAAAAVN